MAKGARRISLANQSAERSLEREVGLATSASCRPIDPPATPVAYPSNAILLPVTPADLARCIENQRRALIHIITDANSPPIDGGLAMITAGLDALARVVPMLPDRKETP